MSEFRSATIVYEVADALKVEQKILISRKMCLLSTAMQMTSSIVISNPKTYLSVFKVRSSLPISAGLCAPLANVERLVQPLGQQRKGTNLDAVRHT